MLEENTWEGELSDQPDFEKKMPWEQADCVFKKCCKKYKKKGKKRCKSCPNR